MGTMVPATSVGQRREPGNPQRVAVAAATQARGYAVVHAVCDSQTREYKKSNDKFSSALVASTLCRPLTFSPTKMLEHMSIRLLSI